MIHYRQRGGYKLWRTCQASICGRNLAGLDNLGSLLVRCVQAILDDLHSSRQAQKAAKLVQQAEMAEREKSDFERIIQVNRAKERQCAKMTSQVNFIVLHA